MSDTVLVFEGVIAWRVALAAVIGALVLGLTWMGLRSGLPRHRQVWLLGLRFVALLVLVLLFLEPALQERQIKPVKRRIALLIDGSSSMNLPADEERSRIEEVAAFLERESSAIDALARRFTIEAHQFDHRLRSLGLKGVKLGSDGPRTDLVSALAQLGAGTSRAEDSADLAGVVIITDGADTAQLADVPVGGSLPPAVEDLLESFPAPVNAFAVGVGGGFKDLSISSVAADDFAFIRNAVEIEVSLSSAGLDEVTVPVVLEQGGRNLASATVRVGPGETTRTVLKFVPDRVGKFVYKLSTPVLPGETLSRNNTRTFVTRIIRDKIRVLHLVGRPSWDERFLRQVLKRNPNVDLVSFFILRTTSDTPGVSQDELSLIPFPVADLFGSELPTFDVVIFQNFNHGPYQVTFFLPQLRQYVADGGAFLMIGGDLSFGSGGYASTPLEDVLPVRSGAGGDVRVQEFRAMPATGSDGHPVMDLGPGDIWGRLPPVGSYNHVDAVQPGAFTLLEHPYERVGAARAPIVVLREVGRGRSAAVLTDGTWRWNFKFSGEGGSPRPYHRFYNNLLRWLIQDPGLQAVSLRASRTRFLPEEPVRLSVRLHGPEGQTSARFELFDAVDGKLLERRSVDVDETGRTELEFERLEARAYLGKIEAFDGERTLGTAEEAFVVSGVGLERSRPQPRPDLLKRIAAVTGGQAEAIENADLGNLVIDERERYRVESSVTRPLMSRGWVLAGLVCLMGLEWWSRRRWGFA